MTVRETAHHFKVDPATVRRWVCQGCPTVRKGRRGPGRGAQLDLAAVEAWRGRGSGPPGLSPDEVLQQIAVCLWEAIERDRADIRAGISRDDVAAALLVVWARCCRTFERSFKFDGEPEPIRALMRIL